MEMIFIFTLLFFFFFGWGGVVVFPTIYFNEGLDDNLQERFQRYLWRLLIVYNYAHINYIINSLMCLNIVVILTPPHWLLCLR